MHPLAVEPGDQLHIEFAQMGLSLLGAPITSLAEMQTLRQYIAAPPGLTITRGERLTSAGSAGLFEVVLDAGGAAALSLPKVENPNAMLPLRFRAANPLWTVGLWQVRGLSRNHPY
jgi:hypothetical protein